MLGTVKWYSKQKQFGFIVADGYDQDIFVHEYDLEVDPPVLLDGQHVDFQVQKGPKGLKAKNVKVVPVADDVGIITDDD